MTKQTRKKYEKRIRELRHIRNNLDDIVAEIEDMDAHYNLEKLRDEYYYREVLLRKWLSDDEHNYMEEFYDS